MTNNHGNQLSQLNIDGPVMYECWSDGFTKSNIHRFDEIAILLLLWLYKQVINQYVGSDLQIEPSLISKRNKNVNLI